MVDARAKYNAINESNLTQSQAIQALDTVPQDLLADAPAPEQCYAKILYN